MCINETYANVFLELLQHVKGDIVTISDFGGEREGEGRGVLG